MTFQIISNKTNEAISLTDFDNLYCAFNNITPDKFYYAYWFHVLEGGLLTYADLADNADTTLILRRRIVKDYRSVSMHQLVQALTIRAAKIFDNNETYRDWERQIDWLKPVVQFFLSVKDKYHFIFNFQYENNK